MRYYLTGRRFVLYTDHKALMYMLEQKKLTDMLERWLDEILDFNFSIEHIPGVSNVLPDLLSRLYCVVAPSFSLPSVVLPVVPSTGIPVCVRDPEFDLGPMEIARMADWVPPLLFRLGGGSLEEFDIDAVLLR